jgi:hypothetical protein
MIEAVAPQTSSVRKAEIEWQLLAYCEMDTSAYVDGVGSFSWISNKYDRNMTIAVNVLNPVAVAKSGWIFRHGDSFYNLKTRLIRSLDGAVMIPVADADCRRPARCKYRVSAA